MICVELDCLVKWFKTNPLELAELKNQKVVSLKNPEGTKVPCLLFKTTQSVPDGLPYFKLEMFSEDYTTLEDIFLDKAEDFHEGQPLLTHQVLLANSLEDRLLRITGVPHLLTWNEFKEKVDAAQKAMEEKEQEAQRQMRLAETGQAAETIAELVTTGSRFRRRGTDAGMEVEASLKARRGSRGGGGGFRGRGRGGRSGARPSAAAVACAPASGSADGVSVGAGYSTPVKRSAVSGAPSSLAPDTPIGAVPATADVRCEKLKMLLISAHGKIFPTIPEILNGTKIKREMNGATGFSFLLPLVHCHSATWHLLVHCHQIAEHYFTHFCSVL